MILTLKPINISVVYVSEEIIFNLSKAIPECDENFALMVMIKNNLK
jgi:hypothetical protein